MAAPLASRRLHLTLLLLLFGLGWVSPPAWAASPLEKLLMPGPVAAAHAKIEAACEACHRPFEKAVQAGLCLDCHKPVKADMEASTGFHGRSALVKATPCAICHSDHNGRDFDMVPLDRAAFDHLATDYPLSGAHRLVGCPECHKAGKRWAEAPSTCFGCHEKDQPHRGNLGKECQSCHRVAAWRETIAFDHSRTRFPLRGKHAAAGCASCHVGEIYKGAGLACDDCHAIQDVHERRFGTECQTCHTEDGWKGARFDHGAKTRFPLGGAHAKARCEACHGASPLTRIATACYGCHAAQDAHKGQLGPDCAGCHSDIAWRRDVKFDHGLTKFPLTGLHVVVACEFCHASPAYKDAGAACADCHDRDDVHGGRFTARCESCHTANGWKDVHFDHNTQTNYPLTGRHAATGCYNCHVQKNVASASLPTACLSCHAGQDVHRGKFGRDCAQCHSTATFKIAIIRRRP